MNLIEKYENFNERYLVKNIDTEGVIQYINTQKLLGQFYTNKNIFNNLAFLEWWNNIPETKKQHILEPFAGSNGIIKMLKKLNLLTDYTSYDIQPMDKEVLYRNTILDFPKDFKVVVTNPPFLAKNSAKRHGLTIDIGKYHDLYELCLEVCLNNTEYLAAIIPESFITNQRFDKSRLLYVISLQEKKIFKDTEHPVCLALFTPHNNKDFKIYHNNDFIGYYAELKKIENQILKINDKCNNKFNHNYEIVWHHPEGQIGLKTIDVTNAKEKIKFMDGNLIASHEVNLCSRLRTRILIKDKRNQKALSHKEIESIIKDLNIFFNHYREKTHDVFLTAFKGLRNDNKYRRRLDFAKARIIVDSFFCWYNH